MYTLISSDLSKEQITLEQLLDRNSYTLLYFYPKNDTPGCTLEALEFTELVDAFARHHVQIIGVSKDGGESHCSFIHKYQLRPFYLSDPELVLHKQFGARGEKNNYGKIVQGVIRSTILLDKKGNILHTRSKVRATGHAKKVYAEISHYLPKP